MLTPLLAVLLCAANDSSASSPVLSVREADSLALERISPLPPTNPPAPAAETFLDPGSFGVGFRTFGRTNSARLMFASPDGVSTLEVVGSFEASEREEDRDAIQIVPETSGPDTTTANVPVVRNTSFLEFQLLLGRMHSCRGSLCAQTSFGPLFTREVVDLRNIEVGVGATNESRTEIVKLGLALNTGLRWELREGLVLAADIGAKAVRTTGTSRNELESSLSWNEYEASDKGDIEGSEFSVEFLGIGLEAWF